MNALPVLAAAATGVQVGAAIVATRVLVDQLGPFTITLGRYAIGALCLVPVLLLAGRWPRFRAADLVPIALLGTAQFGLLIALLNYGLRTVPSARAALILSSFPLITMLLAAALGRERLTVAKTLGVLLTMLGVGAALGDRLAASDQDAGWYGELAILAAACCGALCTVLYRPYLQRYPTLPVGFVAMVASVLALGMPALGESLVHHPPSLDAAGWAALSFIGVSSGGGYFLWLWALKHTTPTRVTVFLALSPITAMLAGAALLGEPVTPAGLAGLALVTLGLVLAHR